MTVFLTNFVQEIASGKYHAQNTVNIIDSASLANMKEDGAHTSGPIRTDMEWLIKEHQMLEFGVEIINTDIGQSYASWLHRSRLRPARADRCGWVW